MLTNRAVFIVVALAAGCRLTAGAETNMTSETTKVLIEYIQYLGQENKLHREFLEGIYTHGIQALTGTVLVFGAIITWLNWKTRQEMRTQVGELFRSTATGLIDQRMKELDAIIVQTKSSVEDARETFKQQLQDVNRTIFDLVREAANRTESGAMAASLSLSLMEKKVLWVDDFPRNNDGPRAILEHEGVEITEALSTEAALEELGRTHFDLIISDMGRGENLTAGLDLLKELKKRRISVPIIIFASTRAVAMHELEARNLGALEVTAGTSQLLKSVFYVLRR